ncbi:MAG TPA: hypothetical protein DCZ34_01250 [Clostridiales bacterium]|nr:hypothetical protein [Clostridiales bacterium]
MFHFVVNSTFTTLEKGVHAKAWTPLCVVCDIMNKTDILINAKAWTLLCVVCNPCIAIFAAMPLLNHLELAKKFENANYFSFM